MYQKRATYTILNRLTKYAIGGSISSLLDLTIFLILVEIFKVYYLISSGFSFSIAYIFYYFINRNWTFKGTKSNIKIAFVTFITYAIFAVFLSISSIYILTEIIGFHYIISKIITLPLVGIISFTFHYNFSFKMRKKKYS